MSAMVAEPGLLRRSWQVLQGTSPSPKHVSLFGPVRDPGIVALLIRGRTEAGCRSLKAQACPLQQGCPCL